MGRLIPAYFNWSGGKDSTLALYKVLQEKQFEIRYLLTTFNEEADRISMHGVRRELLISQAESIGIPVKTVHLPSGSDMQGYENAMNQAIRELKNEGISDCIFGDIFLEDLRSYREERLREAGISAHFPLWKRNTGELVREFIDLGFKTVVVCTDSSKLEDSFAGRIIDPHFLADLPGNVDPCGENGEFHTFVFDGPVFRHPVLFETGEKVCKTYTATNQQAETIDYRFCFQELIPL